MLKYNYVFFNVADAKTRKKDPNGYNAICVKDLEDMEGVQVVSYPLDYAPYIVRWLFAVHHTPKINKIIKLPFKKAWYPHYFKAKFKEKKPICFVISGTYLPVEYLRYLKKKYPDAKFVKIHRDLVSLWWKLNPSFTPEIVKEIFDLSFAYDEEEAKQLGWSHFNEFESKIDVPISPEYPLSDVFFAGRVKDRFPKLLEIYDVLTKQGLRCNYYLMGVPKEKRVQLPGIEYAERSMSYSEMLYRSVNSRCILEVNQAGAVGYTSRFLEAVLFNKRLLTDNRSIKNSKFYNPKNICCFNHAEELDAAFVLNEEPVEYYYGGEFSPVNLIKQIDEELLRIGEEKDGGK